MSRAALDNDSPTKKQKKNSTDTEDCKMTSDEDTEQIHTYEILLDDKEKEILSLRKRLGALSASKEQQVNELSQHIAKPDSQDREPLNHSGTAPAPPPLRDREWAYNTTWQRSAEYPTMGDCTAGG